MKPFDYLGLLGQDQKRLGTDAQNAWRLMRDFMVHGNPRHTVPNPRDVRFMPGYTRRASWQSRVFDNLPKFAPNWMKTEYEEGLGKTGFMDFQWGGGAGLDALIGRLHAKPKPRRYLTVNSPIQGANSALAEEAKNMFNPYGKIGERRVVMGLDPANSILAVGLSRGLLSGDYLDRPTNIDPLLKYKRQSLRHPPGGHVCFDFEADMNTEEAVARMFLCLDESNLYRGLDGGWVHRTYNPDDPLTKMYTQEREKKYDHKDAVSRVLKKRKWHDKKGTARRLEFIGAAYEENKKALTKKPAVTHTWLPSDFDQVVARAKRNAEGSHGTND